VVKVFDGLQLRDVNPHNSSVFETYARSQPKLVIFKNTHDQALSLQLQGSIDTGFTNPVKIGPAVTAPAGMTAPDYQWLREPWWILRIVATAAVAPSSGQLDVWIE